MDSRALPNELTFTELVATLWRGRWWAIGVLILVAAGGLLFVSTTPPVWRVQSVVETDLGIANSTGQGPVLTAADAAAVNAAHAAKLTARSVLETVLEEPAIGDGALLAGEDNHLTWLKKNVSVDVGGDDGLITLAMTSPHRDEACRVINRIVEVYRAQCEAAHRQLLGERQERLVDELARQEGRLREEQERLLETLAEHPDAVPPGGAGPEDALQLETRRELLRLQDRRRALSAELTADHDVIRGLDASIADLQQRLSTGVTESADGFFDAEVQRMRVDQARGLSDALHQRVLDFSLTAPTTGHDGALGVIRVLEEAAPRTATVAVSKTVLVAICLLLGLVLATVAAFLGGSLDRRVRSPRGLFSATGIRVLGGVPVVRVKARSAVATWFSSSDYAEAMRAVRAAVVSAAPGSVGQSLVVAAPDRRDGASLVAAGLAIAFARSGERVLLLDANLRMPGQRRLFELGAAAEIGLVELLIGRANPDAVIIDTAVRRLDVLSAGGIRPNSPELLHTARFSRVVQNLKSDYDRVIIDAPPVLGQADARVLASHCDAAILVARAGRSTSDRVAAASEVMRAARVPLLGTVLNQLPRHRDLGLGVGAYGALPRGLADDQYVLTDFDYARSRDAGDR